jgi:hypothetical protein
MLPWHQALHPRRWNKLAVVPLVLALSWLWPASAAASDEAPCSGHLDVATVRPAPPDARVEVLPTSFRGRPHTVDQQQLLTVAQRRVLAELADVGAASCYASMVPTIADRTAFLAPLEFLAVSYYDRDWNARDGLLQLYRSDPQQAVQSISSFWPSPRAEMMMSTPAFFDIDTDQIYVNLGALSDEQALNVVVHEFWHALADVDAGTRPDGTPTRTTGFWTEAQADGSKVWRPVDEFVAGGVLTYMMNEAAAVEMEQTATGRPHDGMRPDLADALDTLHELFALAGRDHVIQLYLSSRSDELKELAQQVAPVAGR